MCLLSAGKFDCKNCEQKSDFKDYKPFLDVFSVFLEFHSLKEAGQYSPHIQQSAHFARKIQPDLNPQLQEIFIYCKMLPDSIFYAFFKSKTLGPKRSLLCRNPKSKFLKRETFAVLWLSKSDFGPPQIGLKISLQHGKRFSRSF